MPILCAVVSVAAALIALAAPVLRSELAAVARAWLGRENAITQLLAPEGAAGAAGMELRIAELERDGAALRQRLDEAQRAAPSAAALDSLAARLAAQDGQLQRLASSLESVRGEVSRAVGELRAASTSNPALARAVDGLAGQTAKLGTLATALDARLRATGLVALSLRLRRDIDSGMPIEQDRQALTAAGPHPAAISHAIEQLRSTPQGVPTMRDLGQECDALIAQLEARSAASQTWASRGWAWAKGWVATEPAGAEPPLPERLRALAAEARFSAAADLVEKSEAAPIGAPWVARVRARSTAVLASQTIMTHALQAFETAYAPQATPDNPAPTQ